MTSTRCSCASGSWWPPFFGIGAALYIVGWLVLPDTPADPAIPEPRKRGILVVGLVIATIVSVGSIFGGRGGFILPLLAVAALLFLLHRSRADRGPAAVAPPSWPQPTEGVSLVKGVSKEDEQQPPSWDPLGAAPFAWDLPEPGPATPPAPPKRRRAPVTLVTLGLALLAGAGTGVVLLTSGVAGVPTFPVLLGVVAAVLGLGLVVGSFLRAGRGLIPFAVLVSLLIWGALSAPWHRFGPEDGFGELRAAPTTVAQLQPEYRRGAGDVTLDLRGLDLSGTGDVRTAIDVGAGDAEVRLPANADVTFTGEAGLGDVEFDGRKYEGPGSADGRDPGPRRRRGALGQAADDRRPRGRRRRGGASWLSRISGTEQTEVIRRRRGPDPLALVVGVLTLGMAVAAFTGQLPVITFDPRWLIAAAAAVVGALLLLGSLRRR